MNTDIPGNHAGSGNGIPNVTSPEACQIECQNNKKCTYWTYCTRDHQKSPETCFLKTSNKPKGFAKNTISGPKFRCKYITVR